MREIRLSEKKKYVLALSIAAALLVGFLCLALGLGGKRRGGSSSGLLEVQYTTTAGGDIVGDSFQYIERGGDAEEVTAIARWDYYFVQWSDGLKSATRKDTHIDSSLNIIAEFTRITDGIGVTYKTNNENAYVTDSHQYIQIGTDGKRVEAKLRAGEEKWRFVGWSDGVQTPWRHDKNVTAPIDVTALYGYRVDYGCAGKGHIEGETAQAVLPYKNAQAVTAVPDRGYRFVRWTDGVQTRTRRDTLVYASIDVYAIFEWREEDDFVYHYNLATFGYEEDSLHLERGNVRGKMATVPSRDYFTFDGWFFDEALQERATDAQGNILAAEKFFDNPSSDLYAKWLPKKEYIVSYPILMVYPTEIDATFTGKDGNPTDVRYKMSEDDKLLYLTLTKRFEETLDGLMDGLINFQVSSYFTSHPIDESSFDCEPYDTNLWANDIPELKNSGLSKKYRTVMTVFSLDDAKNLYIYKQGKGKASLGSVWIDSDIRYRENLQDAAEEEYRELMSTLVSEFIYSLQAEITCYSYYPTRSFITAPSDPNQLYFSSETVDKLYLFHRWACNLPRNCPKEELKKTWNSYDMGGIPYTFWTRDIYTVSINEECVNGVPAIWEGSGSEFYNLAFGKPTDLYETHDAPGWAQRVPKGEQTSLLRIILLPGYKFLGWSDGSMELNRTIANVRSDISLTAYVERLSYTHTYVASEGGHIEGIAVQTGLVHDRCSPVAAIADEGYRFVCWSNYYPLPERGSILERGSIDVIGYETYYTDSGYSRRFVGDVILIAGFEKIAD